MINRILKIYGHLRNLVIARKFSRCGKDFQVFGKCLITGGNGIEVGDRVRINDGVKLFCRKGCKIIIGDDVTISANSTILSSSYDVTEFMENSKRTHEKKNTIIGDNVWLCANVTVCGGVEISGNHVIIAAGGVVTGNIKENYCLYAGVPAKLKKKYRY